MHRLFPAAVFAATLCLFNGHAVEDRASRWAGVATLGVGLTGLKDNSPIHLMTHENARLLLGYRFSKWLVGPIFDYRFEQQHSSLASSGGTNFAGSGWTLGLGARYDLLPSMSLQLGAVFLGRYSFARQTYASEDAHLSTPIGLQVGPQFFLVENRSLSLDLDLRFLRWIDFIATSGNLGVQVSDFSIGISLSYHFPGAAQSEPPKPTPSEKPVVTEPLNELADTLGAEKTEQGLMINLSGALFAVGSAELKDESSIQQLLEAGKVLSQDPSRRIRIEGHTDSVGSEKSNLKLSQSRADSIKAVLIQSGVPASAISTKGFGASKPTADNGTAEGRTKNRRIEIYIDEK